MIKILFLAANPPGTTPQALDEEVRAIDAKVRGAGLRDRLQLVSHWADHLDDLSGLLMRERPDIVHFSGHGSKSGEIILTGDDIIPKRVLPASLAERFRILKNNIRAVVLNACYSEVQAREIVKSIDCAVGMSDEIVDDRSIDFAAAFYEALAYGESVRVAFDLGVARLSDEGVAEGLVKLHMRRGVHPSRLVLINDEVKAKLDPREEEGSINPASPTQTRPGHSKGDGKPPLVFISYSRADITWLERLLVHLAPLEREGAVESWNDTKIATGMRWHDQIKAALASAKVAVLLVSPDFLASDYIANDELPPLLAAEKARGLVVMPVIISASRFGRTPSLAQFQAVNHGLKPLSELPPGEQEALWVRLVDAIEKGAKPGPSLTPPGLVETRGGRWNVPPKNPFFTGREHALTQLRSVLAAQSAAALYGMPGVGKTQTAIEYAHRYRTDYVAVLWSHAGSPEILTSGYLALALLLGLPKRDEPDRAAALASVQDWLRHTPGWLMILDGVDRLSAVKELLPTDGPGHLLLTTRDPAVVGLVTGVEVSKMLPEEGACLLLRRAVRLAPEATLEQAAVVDREAALATSMAVDGLPLALAQAGAYIVECEVSPDEYQELYNVEGGKLRARRPDIAERDQASVTTTFLLAFAQLEASSPPTAELLRLSSLLGPVPIPEEVFLAAAPDLGDLLRRAFDGRPALLDTVRKASGMSLLRRSPGSRTVTLHRLVRDVIRDEMSGELQQVWLLRATLALSRAFPEVKPDTWPECERLLPHCLSCFSEVEKWGTELLKAGRVAAGRLLNQVGYYLMERARYEEAKPLFRRALEINELASGRDDPDTLRTRHSIARWTAAVGDAREALRLFRELLTHQRRVQGPDHPDTLGTRHDFAYWTGEAGDLRKALRLSRALLATQRRALGPDHPKSLKTRRNIARWTGEAGHARKALQLFCELLPDQERVQGSLHPDTLLTRHDIAHWTGEAGDAREALRLCRELLPDRLSVHGADHPETLGTRHSIAYWTGRAEDAREALQLCRELLPDRERVQSLVHPDTLITRRDIARWTGQAGDAREALRLLRELLPDQERVQGRTHPDTLGMYHDVARWAGEAGDAREALRLLRELLPDQERVLGSLHPDTLLTRHDIGHWTGEAGDAREALRLLRELLPTQRRVQGRDHSDTLDTRQGVARWTGEAGDAREAMRLFRELLLDQERALGRDHPATLETQKLIARLETVP